MLLENRIVRDFVYMFIAMNEKQIGEQNKRPEKKSSWRAEIKTNDGDDDNEILLTV